MFVIIFSIDKVKNYQKLQLIFIISFKRIEVEVNTSNTSKHIPVTLNQWHLK